MGMNPTAPIYNNLIDTLHRPSRRPGWLLLIPSRHATISEYPCSDLTFHLESASIPSFALSRRFLKSCIDHAALPSTHSFSTKYVFLDQRLMKLSVESCLPCRLADASKVKVLYSLDTSSQSYLTVLSDRHDVYVHQSDPGPSSGGGSGSNDGTSLGSCCLKGVSWGICFAR